MSRRCPRCGAQVDDGIFPICTKCGAAAGSKAWQAPDGREHTPTLSGSVFAGRDAAGRPHATGTATRLLAGAIVAIVVGAVGFAVLSATIGDGGGSSSGAASSASAPAASSTTARTTGATTATAAATQAGSTTAPAAAAAVTEDACTRAWNAAKNAQARAGLVELRVHRARIRPTGAGCVLVALLPGSPRTATRFTEQQGIYAVEGPAATVPVANARIDARGRAVLGWSYGRRTVRPFAEPSSTSTRWPCFTRTRRLASGRTSVPSTRTTAMPLGSSPMRANAPENVTVGAVLSAAPPNVTT